MRRICESCAQPYQVNEQECSWLNAALGVRAERIALQHGAGCHHCNNTGYRGRQGIFELLEIDGDMADALRNNDSAAFAKAARSHPDFKPLVHSALDYAVRGVTTLKEVFRVAGELEEAVRETKAASPMVSKSDAGSAEEGR